MQVPLVVKHVSRKIEEQMNLNVFFCFSKQNQGVFTEVKPITQKC